MIISTLKTALYTWAVANAGGVTVVWADQEAPRPTRPYITLRLNGPFRVHGNDEQRHNPSTGKPDIVGHRRLILSIQVMGNNAQQTAQNLNFSLEKPSVLASLYVSGISVTNPGNITNITTYLETNFEQRFTFDVELLALASTLDDNGYFDKVETEGLDQTQIIGD